MITYEVTATVREDLRGRYEVFMRERHIPDVLMTELFVGAHFLRGEDGRYRARYDVSDRDALDRYLTIHAGRLRGDMLIHFPEGIIFERETWNELVAWPH